MAALLRNGIEGNRDVGSADDSVDRILHTGLGEVRRVGFRVPYPTRIARIATYYQRDGRIISIYDSVTLVIIVALVILLFLTDLQDVGFITGLVVGMLTIQIFFHRFDKPLAPEQAPESGAPPRKVMSYTIQAQPALAWREILVMTVLFGWALYALIGQLVR
jgi:hypothetical protein